MTDPPQHGRPTPPAASGPGAEPGTRQGSRPGTKQSFGSSPGPVPRAAGQGPAPLWRTLLYILVPTVGLLLLVAAFFFALTGRSGSVDLAATEAPGTSLSVQIPNASVTLEPSTDDQIRVSVTGTFFGSEPTLSVRTEGGVTEVRGGCRTQLFSHCSIRVAVQLPRALPTTVDGENGRIEASGLTGRLTLETSNGTIEARGTVGRLDAETTNGDVTVTDATSTLVQASTTNGSVELDFTDAPDSVDATSTNGSVIVRVPVSQVSYLVTAQTTNGSVNTETVPSDRTSRRSITAQTTNGSVTVEAAR
jgi:DUF4097 and DUF4098 domain-containing protein YvlB